MAFSKIDRLYRTLDKPQDSIDDPFFSGKADNSLVSLSNFRLENCIGGFRKILKN
jgi:hypothetical protein